ncbi:SulP family inorganic anion transporter [Diaminobutyricibacter sp. McL0618]|uniref:SulP family inorganic anion transporter n=1 Tax=Leifsonia sp. McL0618 TaxID=3415677 RepID=UPI003CEA7386
MSDDVMSGQPRPRLILPGLTVHNLSRELLAGVTLLAIALPVNIGYAQIAGLPATAGLYALIVPAVVWALFASSRQLVASPDAAASALVASSLGGLAVAGGKDYATLALAQAIIGGVMFFACAVFRLGFLANFLSKPILTGFVGGLALDILLDQVAKMLGVKIASGEDFLVKLGQLITRLPTLNGWSVLISAGSIAIILVGRRLLGRVPWALVALGLATLATTAFGLEAAGVAVLGRVQAGAPRLTWPVLDWGTWAALIPSAAALTIVAMGEGLLVSRAYGAKRGYRVNLNRDLFAFGAANVAAGASGAFTMGSSTSRTAAMDQAGSRTQVPALVTAAATLLLVVFGTGVLEHIPSPAIGAIITVAVVPLLGFREMAALWRVRKFEFAVAAVCFLSSLLIGPIQGILIAFVLALVNLAKRAADPAVDVLNAQGAAPGAILPVQSNGFVSAPGIVVIRFAAQVFFANASAFKDAVQTAVLAAAPTELRHVVIDCEAITDIDVTGAESVAATKQWVRDRGLTFGYCRVRPDLARILADFALDAGTTTYGTTRDAIARLTALDAAVDPDANTAPDGTAQA